MKTIIKTKDWVLDPLCPDRDRRYHEIVLSWSADTPDQFNLDTHCVDEAAISGGWQSATGGLSWHELHLRLLYAQGEFRDALLQRQSPNTHDRHGFPIARSSYFPTAAIETIMRNIEGFRVTVAACRGMLAIESKDS